MYCTWLVTRMMGTPRSRDLACASSTFCTFKIVPSMRKPSSSRAAATARICASAESLHHRRSTGVSILKKAAATVGMTLRCRKGEGRGGG